MSQDQKHVVIKLATTDVTIKIPRNEVIMSELIKCMIEDDDSDMVEIPLQEGKIDTLLKTTEYFKYHYNNPLREIPKPLPSNDLIKYVDEFDYNLVTFPSDSQDKLFELILFANYLNIPSLLNLGIAKIASILKDQRSDVYLKYLGLEAEPTASEEREIRLRNPWIFGKLKEIDEDSDSDL